MESIEKQKEYFKKLTTDRAESTKTLEKPSMRGVKRSVVDKYSDQAHFIYELLQNADDAQATKSKFILSNDGLTFVHNGTICFTVSNPETEDKDGDNKILGHVNAITSIGNTTKGDAKIGKFGVGFKSVFQYTNTPHIYDPNFKFKIEKFIVPQELENDREERKENETLFFFPFDLPNKSKEEASNDILQKIKSLVHPVLFLNNLKEVVWESEKEQGKYFKEVKNERITGSTVCQQLNLSKRTDGEDLTESLWLFTREDENSHKYSVGFFLDENNKLAPVNYDAFCFFPTKETTKLKFIIHAPFLLTDSREGIKAGDMDNKLFINKLSVLAAESLPILKRIGIDTNNLLIDDNIVNLIPYKQSDFSDLNYNAKISFLPFYNTIKEKLQTDNLLPAKGGSYSSKIFSYWASDTELTELFSDEQISDLMQTPNAKWVFISLGRKQSQNEKEYINYSYQYPKTEYIDTLITDSFDPEKLFRKINSTFIEKQSIDWLKSLYTYLLDKRSYWDVLKKKPIFINSDQKAVPAFDEDGKTLRLFLPTVTETSFSTINEKLLDDDSVAFFRAFGIGEPKLIDEITNNILPLYIDGFSDAEKIKQHFKTFLKYYEECPTGQLNEYLNKLKQIEFIACKRKSEPDKIHWKKPCDCYFPTDDLVEYFEFKPDTFFVDLEFYSAIIGAEKHQTSTNYFYELGMSKFPKIISREVDFWQNYIKFRLSLQGNSHHVWDKLIDGLEEFLCNISNENSKFLWKYLCILIQQLQNLLYQLRGEHEYSYYGRRREICKSTAIIQLTTYKWLYTKSNTFASPKEILVEELADGYERNSNEAKSLIEFLDFKQPEIELILTDEQRKFIELGEFAEQNNLTREDLERIIKIKNRPTIPPRPTPTSKDEDDYRKSSEELDEKISNREEQLKSEIEELTRIQKLTDTVKNAEKYSFLWFKSLLELEYLNSWEKNSSGKEISIQFTKVEKEQGAERILILKHPNRYIPQSIEDIGDITVKLFFDNDSRSVSVEVVNVKEYTLRAKLKSLDEIVNVDLEHIYRAELTINNPVFLLDRLRKSYNQLPLEDSYNLQTNLTTNIEFIFGPPGTGKTTYLAENVLIRKMQEEKNLKILVLTPTNKAADVLVNKITQAMDNDYCYFDWLVRFGITGDSSIEQSPIFHEKFFDIRTKPQNVTVTTIARFPYDSFQPENLDHPLHLKELTWDYIVIDEASMISLANIIFPLYYKKDAQFIIAGDPFQIQPITSVAEWKDENIYTLVELNTFSNPTTIPHNYKVENLTTQYRSIPSIGTLFSHFTYKGILIHNRNVSTQKPLNIKGLRLKDINIIKFPVSRFDSIYKAKRLTTTPFHIYSALFTYEFAKYISEQIKANHSGHYSIGIICPYKAQASLVEKLFASKSFDNTFVDLHVGTIHGFQGDECDIVFSLFNPPPYISDSPDMFLNNQNILNVSISRARDYLFILMPDERTENIENLEKIQRMLELITQNATDRFTQIHSSEIERIIFGNENFINENSFSTTLQSVNIYSESEKLYEVRCDESTIDVQIDSRK
ncbi:MAG: AAA domain-containing protein [Bacteroidota bacterium]